MNKIAVIFFLILLALPVHAARVDNIDGSLRHMQVLIPPQGGPLSLDLALSYDTRLAFEDGPLGLKWTHSYDIILHRNSDGTRIFIGGLGQPHFFFSSTSGLKTSQGDHSTIKHNEDDTWTVGLNNGKKYYFTSEGVLTKIGDHLGNWVTIDRTKPDVVTITDPAKRKAVLHYTGKRIDWIQGPDNKVIKFAYNYDGMLQSVTGRFDDTGSSKVLQTWEFAYVDPESKLTHIKDPEGNITKYEYTGDQVTRMVLPDGVTDMQGSKTADAEEHSVRWSYNRQSRMVGSTKISYGVNGPERVYRYDFRRDRHSSFEVPAGKNAIRHYYDDVPLLDPRYGKLKEIISPTVDGKENILRIEMYDASGNPTVYKTIERSQKDGSEVVKSHLVYKYNSDNEVIHTHNVLEGWKKSFPHKMN